MEDWNTIFGSALIAWSLTILAFGQSKGYMPVSRPKRRVYRNAQPVHFWTLITGYALIGAIGVRILWN